MKSFFFPAISSRLPVANIKNLLPRFVIMHISCHIERGDYLDIGDFLYPVKNNTAKIWNVNIYIFPFYLLSSSEEILFSDLKRYSATVGNLVM